VSKIRTTIESRGIRPVFVHLAPPERARLYFDQYHLSDIERVSNPAASLYLQPIFGLQRKNVLLQLLVPHVWKAWLQGALRNHGIGLVKEDADQMPGIFYLRNRAIVRSFLYRTIADEPDYLRLIA